MKSIKRSLSVVNCNTWWYHCIDGDIGVNINEKLLGTQETSEQKRIQRLF